MNANNKETKSASKAQKKTQKANKKQQQQKQQQQQQQQQINNTRRNSNGKNSQTTSTTSTTTTTTSFGNNNGVIVNGGNGGSNRVNGKPTKTLHNNQQISYTNNNNNNNNINNNNNNIKSKDTIYNNNNIENNNNTTEPVNISKKLKDYYVSEKNKTIATTTPTTMPGYENVPKMERSNSFSLRGKLSKLINSITGSKENLPKATDEENGKAPYSFTRSRSMILLRRPNRRSLIEPQLEQLSEEAEKSNDTMSPTSPRKNSLAETAESDTAESPVQLRRRADTLADQRTAAAAAAVAAAGALRVDGVITPARRQSAQPFTASTPLEEFERLQRKPSLISLTPSETSYNPQLNFQKRRSNTLIASFKSTFAGLATSSEQKKKEKMNPKWSASLQSLQAIDNMVSYENMSFIDYDKFNGYEKQLERQLSIMSINERQQQLQQQQQQQQQQYRQPTSPSPMLNNSNNNNSVSRGSLRSMDFTPPNVGGTSSQSPSMTTPQTVVRRRKHSPSSMAAHWPSATSPTAGATRRHKSSSRTSLRSVNSFNFDTDYEHNLDKLRNVYRDSLDSRKLELLNELSRNSFILDKHVVDVLNLEDGSVDCRRRATCTTHRRQTSYTGSGGNGNGSGRDVVDATNSHTGAQLKSKSLTHLDGLDSMIACQHGPPSAATTTTTASTTTATSLTAASARQHQQQQYQQANVQVEKLHQRESKKSSHTNTNTTTNTTGTSHQQHTYTQPPTIYTQAPQQQQQQVLSPTITTSANSSCCQSRSCCPTSAVGNSGSGKHAHFSQQQQKQQQQQKKQQYYNSSNNSSSTVGVAPPTSSSSSSSSAHHHHYQQLQQQQQPHYNNATHANVQQQFQSNIESAVIASMVNTLSLSPAIACSATPTSMGGSTTSGFYYGSGAATPIPTPTPTTTSAPTATTKKKSSFMTRKKPLLTRSEVSSSEYFSVNFCMESSGSGIGGGSNCQDEEFIPAMKGVTLFTALAPALRKRGFTFSQINITDNNPTPSFLDAGISPLASSLDENTEVENLAGHHLIVTERESSRKTLQKAASFGSRTRPPRLLSSASTEETSESGGATGKQIKQRWSGLFGTKNPSQSQLCDLLNSYAKNGVPQKTASLNFSHPDFDAAVAYIDNMHKSWRDFVDSEGMSDSEVKIQTAIWELVTTEVYYIHALQTVTDLFLACLEALQDERLLADVDQLKLFSNVRDICEANLKFWTIYLYPMVAHSVTTREPLRCAFFQDGFVNFASIFAPYKKYCAEQSTCHFYCKELNRTNALFTSYLAWCESQKMCNRLKLADIIVRPMQRLTKYNLLLGAIKKHMSDVDEIEAVDTMLHSVENFVCSVNNHLTMRQENERLKGVMARIESYDVVDTNNEQLDKLIKHYSQMFDLCAPMKDCPAHQVRHLFMEGDHKFKDNLGKADVHCFLLTDMLLVCKTIAKKGLGTLKVIRQPYLTDRLMVNMAPNNSNTLNCVYLNEFEVAVTAFTLQCLEAKKWYEALRRTKLIYTRLKQGTSGNWGDLRFGGSSTSGGNADSLGVKKSPMNSSICSHVSSANNSHSGSVEWNDSRNISVDFEKTNSLSSDEGSSLMIGAHHAAGVQLKNKQLISGQHKLKIANASSANTLSVQPVNHLGQSLPNLNLHHSHTNLYHTYSNNTLLVPGTTSSHSGNLLLSPSHRGISYPPPSPTRVPLRRGMAFSTSTKNPPLLKTRNITSQNSINWHQIPATPTPPSPQSQHNSPGINATVSGSNVSIGMGVGVGVGVGVAGLQKSLPALITNNLDQTMQQKLLLQQHQQQQQQQQQQQPAIQLSNQNLTEQLTSNETDV